MDIKETLNNYKSYRHPWELARLEIVKKELLRIVENTDTKKINIIDIGCGDLFVLEKIKSYFNFKQLIGVDTAINCETLQKHERKYQDTNILIYNDINKIEIGENETSIVFLFDVIEHIKDDKKFLTNLQKYDFVNENTFFYITVPSFQSLFSKHDEFLEHYRRYNNKQLIDLLINSGYKSLRHGYFFSILLLPRILTIIKERIFKKTLNNKLDNTNLAKWDKGKFTTSVIKNILLIDYYFSSIILILKIKLPGLSNYIICKKSV